MPVPSSSPLQGSPVCWTHTAAAREALCALDADDLCLTLASDCPGPDRLVWHPASARGTAVFAQLDALRRRALVPMPADPLGAARALATAHLTPSIDAFISGRFGDPARWIALGPQEATRRLRAAWHQPSALPLPQARRSAAVSSANSAATTASGVGHPVRYP